LSFSKELIAPCGINCGVCIEHLKETDRCHGCLSAGNLRGRYGVKCGWKSCSEHKKAYFKYCYECPIFPCAKMKSLEKRYVEKYKLSVIDNLNYIKQNGEYEFIKRENERWKCKNCGKMLCVHRNYCLNCKTEYK
jgi:Protein of unknown function (DUF3795)